MQNNFFFNYLILKFVNCIVPDKSYYLLHAHHHHIIGPYCEFIKKKRFVLKRFEKTLSSCYIYGVSEVDFNEYLKEGSKNIKWNGLIFSDFVDNNVRLNVRYNCKLPVIMKREFFSIYFHHTKISCRWYITKMAIFSDWFAMQQQNRSGMLDSIQNDYSKLCHFDFLFFSLKYFVGVRHSEQNSEQNRHQIYCIERDQLPRLDYNEVVNQSKEGKEINGFCRTYVVQGVVFQFQ